MKEKCVLIGCRISCIMSFMILLNYLPAASQVATSKEFKYSVSKPYPVIDAKDKDYFLAGNNIIAVKQTGKAVSIQRFDKNTLNQLSVREVDDMPRGTTLEGHAQSGNHIYIFFSAWDKENKKEQLFVREVDPEKGSFAAKEKLLISVDGKITGAPGGVGMGIPGGFGSFATAVVDKFDFFVSADSTKMFIQYRKKPETKDDSKSFDQIGMYVFDFNLTKIWSKEVTMPYTEFKMDIEDFSVDSKGNTYVLAKVYQGDKKRVKEDGFIVYDMELLKYDSQSQALSTIKLQIAEKYLQTVKLTETKEGNLTLVGFYSNGNKKESGVDGIFMSKLTPDGKIVDVQSYNIPLEIINQNISKRAAAKNAKKEADEDGKGAQLPRLEYRWIERRNDGSILIAGEQRTVIRREHRNKYGMVTHVTYTYYYEDILVTKIAPDGKLAWMKRLPKTQVGSRAPGGLSFKYIENTDNHYFIYMDNVKNLNLPADREPARHSDGAGGYLTGYKVNDQSGSVSKVSIFDSKDVKGTEIFQFEPKRILQVNPNEFVMEAYIKKKQDMLIRIEMLEK